MTKNDNDHAAATVGKSDDAPAIQLKISYNPRTHQQYNYKSASSSNFSTQGAKYLHGGSSNTATNQQ
ncbi:hypothetical protein P3L10_024396 [Capsicum annuum]